MQRDRLDDLAYTDIEKGVLGSFLFDNESFFSAETSETMFTGDRVIVYKSIAKLISSGIEADILTVYHDLGGIVKASVISDMTDNYGSSNIQFSVDKLKAASMRRSIARAYQNGLEQCFSGADPSGIIHKANASISVYDEKSIQCVSELADSFFDNFIEMRKNGINPGIMTGIQSLDRATGGFMPGDWIVVAARPGSGKTSMAMNWARNWGNMGKTGLVFSLEMPSDQLIARLACDVGSIDSAMIFKNKLEYNLDRLDDVDREEHEQAWRDLKSARRQIKQMPLFIDDTARISILDMMTKAKAIKSKFRLDFIVIDYLQLIDGWNKEGQGPKADITRLSKVMAKELEVPVITLCQMNRNIETRAGSKLPTMSDLRDAGSIEQDADAVLFPWFPCHYNMSQDESHAVIFARKLRRGQAGIIQGIRWDGKYFRFSSDESKRMQL